MKPLGATMVLVVASATLLAAQAAPRDAVAADPARYSVLSENDVAQMIRVKYPAGAKSVMHSHPAGCVIFYKDATLKMTTPTGEVRTHEYRAGDVTCGDAHSHLPENVGIAWSMEDADYVLVHHEHHFAEVEGQAWVAYGSPKPAYVLTYDGVPIVSVYENPRFRDRHRAP